jgi:hypothetical protein
MGGQTTSDDIDWLIEQAEKVERYEEALDIIVKSGQIMLGQKSISEETINEPIYIERHSNDIRGNAKNIITLVKSTTDDK